MENVIAANKSMTASNVQTVILAMNANLMLLLKMVFALLVINGYQIAIPAMINSINAFNVSMVTMLKLMDLV